MSIPEITVLLDAQCQLGENPLWDEREQALYWTDINRGKVHRYDYPTGEYNIIYNDIPVGGFTLQEDGSLLLFRVSDIALLRPGAKDAESLIPVKNEGMERFNDVIADPRGRVFAGFIGKSNDDGGLFRIDPDGTVTLLFTGARIPNGMGFSPDRKRFYWTSSTSRIIYSFSYNEESGELSGRQVIYQASEKEGAPDGMTVDAEGNFWSARYGSGRIIHHAPDGKVKKTVLLPADNITSACFSGPERDHLIITTAQAEGAPHKPLDGAIFRMPVDPHGPLEFRSRILTGKKQFSQRSRRFRKGRRV